MSKNNITVFRKEWFLAASEVWRHGDEEIEVGNSYKSLELHFTTILSLIQAVGKDQNQSDHKYLWRLGNVQRNGFLLMYDAQILACPSMCICLFFILFFNLGRMCHLVDILY